ncbi:MAG: hypothetical protein WBM07_09920 [Chitinivibrionales bacterium]
MRLNTVSDKIVILIFLFILPFSLMAFSASPLQYKSFVKDSSLWISDPSGILEYRNDTRSVRKIILSDTVDNDSIMDIAQNGLVLSVLAQSGVYQIDLTTTTVERLPGNRNGGLDKNGKLTVDDDYVWVALKDTLWRFDKLGREWFPYPIAGQGNDFREIYSNSADIYCVLPNSVKIFSTKDEKWLEFPNKKSVTISADARFFLDKSTLVFVDGQKIFRYIIASQSWDVVDARTRVVDVLTQDTALYYLTGKDAFKYSTVAGVIQPLNIPGISQAPCFTRLADSLVFATHNGFTTFDLNGKTTNTIFLPQNISDPNICKLFLFSGTLVALYPKDISAYNSSTQLWENVGLGTVAGKRRIVSWDENGLRVKYAKGYESQLKGSIGENLIVDSVTYSPMHDSIGYDVGTGNPIDTTKNIPASAKTSYQFPYSNHFPFTETDLTLHNTFPEGRYLDFFLDNSVVKQVPTKGVFYRGTSSDNVEEARIGTNTFSVAQSQTLPTTQFEGASVVLQSQQSLSTRDRKIVKVQAGTGLITAKTQYKVIDYSESGVYKIKFTDQNVNDPNAPIDFIVPGSFKVFIDGDQIDSTNYTFTPPPAGTLIFSPNVIIDHSSLITISYQLEKVHPPIMNIEWLPPVNVGEMTYGSVSVSPTDWISPQIGVYHLETDKVHELVNTAIPLEFRTESMLRFLKINPEITLDGTNGKKAMGLAVQSRIGNKMSIIFNDLVTDSGFKTTDDLSRGYGDPSHLANATVSYDVTKEIPLSYYQMDNSSQRGIERRYQLTAGSHFLGYPFLDVSLSRNIVNGDIHDTLQAVHTVQLPPGTIPPDSSFPVDSIRPRLDRNKDKLLFRLYETSSPFVESLLHINRLNYDVSYLLFNSLKEHVDSTTTGDSGAIVPSKMSTIQGSGSAFYGNVTISPTKRISLSEVGLFVADAPGEIYRNEWGPTLMLQTNDAPPGFDITARNELTFKSFADSNASFCTILRLVTITLKPGTWFSFMAWIQPFYWIQDQLTCNFDTSNPGLSHLYFDDRSVATKSLTHTVGANIFPTNDIVFSNKNQWTTSTLKIDTVLGYSPNTYDTIETHNSTMFYTFNDIKWHFGDKRMVQARWEWNHDRSSTDSIYKYDWHRGFVQYTNTWLPWLQTITGVTSSFVSNSMDTSAVTQTGPIMTISISNQNMGNIKSFMNSHTVNVTWKNEQGRTQSSPDITYSMYLKMVLAPNISLDMYNNFSLLNSAFTKYNGNLSIKMIF